jgi:hypothetical protein
MLRFDCNIERGEDGLWSGSLFLRVDGEEHAGTLDGASDAELEQALRDAGAYIEGVWPEKPPADIEHLMKLLDIMD